MRRGDATGELHWDTGYLGIVQKVLLTVNFLVNFLLLHFFFFLLFLTSSGDIRFFFLVRHDILFGKGLIGNLWYLECISMDGRQSGEWIVILSLLVPMKVVGCCWDVASKKWANIA